MAHYAAKTDVSSDKSRAEIERTLMRYGATGFLYGNTQSQALVMFEMKGRRIKFLLPLPDRNAREFTHTPGRRLPRSAAQQDAAYEQAVRQRWRALLLCIKAKLESVQSGIETFEEAFLPHIMLPNGQTVGDWMVPQIESAYRGGDMPPLLPYHGH